MRSQCRSKLLAWRWGMWAIPERFLASLKPWFSTSQRLLAMRNKVGAPTWFIEKLVSQ